MEDAAVREKDDCHGIAENVMFGQMAPMDTSAFNVALDIDMLKDAIVDHCLPVQSMLAAQVDGGMTPGQVAMTPYNLNSPMWQDHAFKSESAAFSQLVVNGGNDPSNFQWMLYGQSPLGAGAMLPAGPGYSPSSPNAYSPTSPGFVPQSPFRGATSPFGTSRYTTSTSLGEEFCVLTYESEVFANESIVLTDVATIQPTVTILQSYITTLFTHRPVWSQTE
ncbi:DNA-directed RNA polymerase II core subunit rpo21 [Marasmius tenuissimus]|uniref:DNA-directed RNA polymerase II core subunit rpo21 n=1 Tax=Marasmius tenuissimus TaxID=585030 RepID=A0ABR2ZC79_9AGAR